MVEIKRLQDLKKDEINALLYRFGDDFSKIMVETVVPIVVDVRENGDSAVLKYTEKFDGIKLSSLMATEQEIEDAYNNSPKEVLHAFEEAKKNIEEFHSHQKRSSIIYSREDHTTLGILYQAIENVAVYVPGGKASYPSSVLMGVIPAQIAGSKNITVITPPDDKGNVPDMIGAICKILGVKKVIKSGGAQGIAAAGFGTESAPKADIIVGPGNIFVTAAKTYLFSMGVIQIDSMAGPSEVLIIGDDTANPEWIAYDMLSQAEHEERAASILVTPSVELANEVKKEIIKDIEKGEGRHEIKKQAIQDCSLILIVDNIKEAIAFSNRYGPEHMELVIKNPLEYLPKIKNVGSLFLGSYAPVAVGDYYTGTNHILPTGGAARFSSGTSVETFIRRTTFQKLTEEGLKNAQKPINLMSTCEGFDDKHGGSVNIRFKK